MQCVEVRWDVDAVVGFQVSLVGRADVAIAPRRCKLYRGSALEMAPGE